MPQGNVDSAIAFYDPTNMVNTQDKFIFVLAGEDAINRIIYS